MDGGWAHHRACAILGLADVRVHRWRARLREVGTLVDRAPGGVAVHRLLDWEVEAVLALIEEWGPVDRSHRKLAHRGSYLGKVFVSPSTLRRVAEKHQVRLPEPARRTPSVPAPWPEWVRWEPNCIWIWDATHFSRARRAVFAIVDVVSRYWVSTVVSAEESSTQVSSCSLTPWRPRACSGCSPPSASTWTWTTPAGPSCWPGPTTAPR